MSQSEADPFYSSAVRSYEPCGSFMIDYEAYSERMGIQMNHILISMNTTIATSVVASDGGGNAASGTTVTNNAPSNTIGSTNAALAVPQGGGGDETGARPTTRGGVRVKGKKAVVQKRKANPDEDLLILTLRDFTFDIGTCDAVSLALAATIRLHTVKLWNVTFPSSLHAKRFAEACASSSISTSPVHSISNVLIEGCNLGWAVSPPRARPGNGAGVIISEFLSSLTSMPSSPQSDKSLPTVPRYTTLSLRFMHMDDGNTTSLMTYLGDAVVNLTHLNLSHNYLGDRFVDVLCNGNRLSRIINLDISSNNVTDSGAILLSKVLAPVSKPVLLDTKETQNSVNQPGAAPGTAGKKKRKDLTSTSTVGLARAPSSVDVMAEVDRNPKVLYLHHNSIGNDGAVALCNVMEVTRLQHLDLRNNGYVDTSPPDVPLDVVMSRIDELNKSRNVNV